MCGRRVGSNGKHSLFRKPVTYANECRMQRDAEYFQTKMDKIEGSGELGKRLLELVQAKNVESGSTRGRPNSPKKSEDSSKSGTSNTS